MNEFIVDRKTIEVSTKATRAGGILRIHFHLWQKYGLTTVYCITAQEPQSKLGQQ